MSDDDSTPRAAYSGSPTMALRIRVKSLRRKAREAATPEDAARHTRTADEIERVIRARTEED